MVVVLLVGILLSLVPLGMKGFQKGRRAGMAELRGVIESARALALAEETDVYVAFSDGSASNPEDRFRRYGVFVPRHARDEASQEEPNLFTRELVGESNWYELPESLLFSLGSEYEVGEGELPVRTVADLATKHPDLRRPFRFLAEDDRPSFPFLMFDADGRLAFPPLSLDAYRHIGIVEAAYQAGAENPELGTENRTYLGRQISPSSGRALPRSELLRINPHHGRTIPLTR